MGHIVATSIILNPHVFQEHMQPERGQEVDLAYEVRHGQREYFVNLPGSRWRSATYVGRAVVTRVNRQTVWVRLIL